MILKNDACLSFRRSRWGSLVCPWQHSNPAWRASDTADVMFNIDNSPEQNGLGSFGKILCDLFFFLFFFFQLPFLGPTPGFMSSISSIWWADIHKALITSNEMNSVYENRADRASVVHMRWNLFCVHVVSNLNYFWNLSLIVLCTYFYCAIWNIMMIWGEVLQRSGLKCGSSPWRDYASVFCFI